jgi:hypothetical protein
MTRHVAARLMVLLAGVALASTIAVVVGWPDPGRIVDLVTGRSIGAQPEAALVVLLCWMLATAATLLAVTAMQPGRGWSAARVRPRTLAVIAAALALLTLGIARQETGYRVCCATNGTSQQVRSLVP